MRQQFGNKYIVKASFSIFFCLIYESALKADTFNYALLPDDPFSSEVVTRSALSRPDTELVFDNEISV